MINNEYSFIIYRHSHVEPKIRENNNDHQLFTVEMGTAQPPHDSSLDQNITCPVKFSLASWGQIVALVSLVQANEINSSFRYDSKGTHSVVS